MFDDLKPKENMGGNPVPPSPAPASAAPQKAVEDIFSDTDKMKEMKPAAKPAVFQPKTSTPLATSAQAFETPQGSGAVKKIFSLVFMVVLLAAVGYGGYRLYIRFGTAIFGKAPVAKVSDVENSATDQNQTPEANSVTPPAASPADNLPSANQEVPATATQTPENSQTASPAETPATTTAQDDGKDSDQDGLTDYEENTLYHTNPNAIDSDSDGLFDREEVKVYHTNPLVKDTDGDGFSDGDEVKNGYNPNGAGKLYEIKK